MFLKLFIFFVYNPFFPIQFGINFTSFFEMPSTESKVILIYQPLLSFE
jgi:hypothetical protein